MWCNAEIAEDTLPRTHRKRNGVLLTIFIADDQTPIEKLEATVANLARLPLTRRKSQLIERNG